MCTATRRCDPDLERVFPPQIMSSRKSLTGMPSCLDFRWFQMWSSWQQRLPITSANLGDCEKWTQELKMCGYSRRVQRSPPRSCSVSNSVSLFPVEIRLGARMADRSTSLGDDQKGLGLHLGFSWGLWAAGQKAPPASPLLTPRMRLWRPGV